ncbi:hypothetical protein [Confluentibacter lentus]|uniref:hypothetical protein n=1 Tax=Confluentibacter lentus TaxID=1699412 RepID=UPI0012FD57B1|nr:hypothetical protein [Confluentibacter lentus]
MSKIIMKHIIALLVIALLLSCGHKKEKAVPLKTESNTENKVELKTVSGEVTDIKFGKDGYTAKIITANNSIYFVTISRSNLNNPEQYKSIQIGEQLSISGDFWIMEGDNQMTVREILE